ncbi:hypothetical protein DAPPUDRAFT_262658 [Daphnia pulex]|uniref:N-acetylneuraminate (7)9-O-acetyltransferase n=1 Tax=Daphnia pulex TaxID=6669 RepID=E9HNE9_DAPPU|nr:hypothetical protein DAPPUDRAFT_262658 [Daphnia pulex]|eukprot:EFX66757.1 hypothetical protein DAPPUDRAFT_262658 [Daphnia pulex]
MIVKRYYDSELPVCRGNLLDQREYRYVREAGESYYANRLHSIKINKGSACRLLHYTPQRLVSCFDHLHYFVHNQTEISGSGAANKLHFMFLGDSRIRHQFYNFVRLIPDFGSQVWPIEITPAFHGDIDITSDILRLGLSFQWRPLINETVMETIRQWATHENERPYFVFLGMAVHHMMKENGGSFKSYQENLMKFAPILGQLANVTRVVWLNQYPSVDSNSWINDVNTIIFSEKIHSYNKAIRRILEKENIPIWDSSNPLAEEYVRACATLKRDEIFDSNGRPCLFKDVTYYDCNDFIHTGYSALSQATQLLFNDICNNHV